MSTCVGRDSSVGIVTRYGLDGLGIESRWRRNFLHQSRLSLGSTQSSILWVPDLTRKYIGRSVAVTINPL